MKTLIQVAILAILTTACATQTRTAMINSTNLEVLAKEDETLGPDLPAWTQDNGIQHNRVYVVGYAEMSANKSPYHVAKAALMDGEVQLLSEAPADVRILTQNALVGAEIDSSEYFQMQTKLQEVLGVQGFKQHENTCRKIVRYGETKIAVVRGCWYRVSASLLQLKKAYAFTLAKKYGVGKANQFKELMQQEINKINNQKRYEDDNVQQTFNRNSNTTSDSNQRAAVRPVSQGTEYRQIRSSRSQGRDLQPSGRQYPNSTTSTGATPRVKVEAGKVSYNR
jgi:hypothetical protein